MSRLLNIGKSEVQVKKLKSNLYFQKQAAIFRCPDANKNDIIMVEENALVCLYGGKQGDHLDRLRIQTYDQRVYASNAFIHPRTLPPTSAAAKYHRLRVYHQVQKWGGVDLPPEEWGWMIVCDRMMPISTDSTPAT